MLMVYRCGKWTKIVGTDLLPGDVVSVGRTAGQDGEEKSVPADMLILAGTAIVNEAILISESTPQWKENSKRFDRGVTVRCLLFLAAFIENHGKTNAFDEDVTKPSFIDDDTNGETQDDDITNEDSESDDDDDHFDSVCSICDNGGKLTCCEGRCFRSFHATLDSEEAQESNCESLCLSLEERESLKNISVKIASIVCTSTLSVVN
ncbi:putative P-type ATPase, A domain superfamily, Zinc finger, RING/FYVE/PHD-type [Helianthus annuus]|nr:putative P-type ATPase, A domain superfamily, Zinc finger, RING/FYVE/PHD-type [Helianthus annuus]